MVRATVQARRLQRLQQIRSQEAAYSSQLAAEAKRSRHAAEDAAAALASQEFEAERASRELQLQEQYDAAMAAVGQGHAEARQAEAHQVTRASEQYWAFVRSQQAEHHRGQAARDHVTNERLRREAPRADLVKRMHRVREVEQERAAAAAAAAATTARQQASVATEVVERDPTRKTPSTSTHLHSARTPVVVREADSATATAFEAARVESEKAAASRRKDTDAEAARNRAAAERGRDALSRMRTEQLREQVKQRLLDAQRLVEARERDLAVRSAAMQAKRALTRAGMSPTVDAMDDLASDGSADGSSHSEQNQPQDDSHLDSKPASPQLVGGSQTEVPFSSPDRQSDDYREHLRIRARALQTEQEQLQRAAEVGSSHPERGQSMPPSAAASMAGLTEGSADPSQTGRTSQRIGELDLALDRLLHRLAPAYSDGPHTGVAMQSDMTSDSIENRSVAPSPWRAQSTRITTMSEPTNDGITMPSEIMADASALPGHQHEPTARGSEESAMEASDQSTVPRSSINEVESALSQLQQRYDAMASAMEYPLPNGVVAVDNSRGDDALSCSSLSSESMHGANSTQSFVAQSDLSEDDAHS